MSNFSQVIIDGVRWEIVRYEVEPEFVVVRSMDGLSRSLPTGIVTMRMTAVTSMAALTGATEDSVTKEAVKAAQRKFNWEDTT